MLEFWQSSLPYIVSVFWPPSGSIGKPVGEAVSSSPSSEEVWMEMTHLMTVGPQRAQAVFMYHIPEEFTFRWCGLVDEVEQQWRQSLASVPADASTAWCAFGVQELSSKNMFGLVALVPL